MSEAKTPTGQNIILRIKEAIKSIQAASERQEFASKSGELSGDRFVDDGNETHALLAVTVPAERELRDLQMCLTRLVDGVVLTNLRLTQELFLMDSPLAFAQLQQRFVREYFTAFQNGIAALMQATNRGTAEPMAL